MISSYHFLLLSKNSLEYFSISAFQIKFVNFSKYVSRLPKICVVDYNFKLKISLMIQIGTISIYTKNLKRNVFT